MIEFSFNKIKLRADFSFFAVIAVLFMLDDEINIISAFLVCLIHETGHLIPMTLFGEKINMIRLYGAGIRIIPEKNPLKPFYRDMIILMGGSIMNFIVAIAIIAVGRKINVFSLMNIIIGIFNLLPYRNFDGGEILISLIEYYGSENMKYHTDMLIRFAGIIISVCLAFIFFISGAPNITLAVTILYLALLSV
jgi:Zn-dependent protease